MTEEELDAAGALAVDEDQDELLEEMSLEERKERLKKARWNVFLYLGIAAILFGFALFPMPFSADYDAFSKSCLLYTSPSPRDKRQSRMPSSA